jgi:long-chain fatty acid transport protein
MIEWVFAEGIIVMKLNKILFVAALMASAAAQTAHAAGFYIQEQSARQQGAAFAGAAANAGDASIIFNNPAAMTDLSGPQITGGAALIVPTSSFTNTGATTGNDGGNPFDPIAVPSLYAAMPFAGGTWWGGIAITAPFGLQNEYNPTWFGRYDSVESVLKTQDIAPSFAVKLNDIISFGGGIDIQHARAKLVSAINTGGPDTFATVKGSSWKVGYNLGVLWDVEKDTKLGLHYRSGITQDLSGHLNVPGFTPGPIPATAELKLPDVVEFGATHQFTPQLKGLATLNWFNWSRFNEIRVNPAVGPDSVTTEDYRDTFAVALGAEWKQDDKWTYRGGVQFDETPTVDAHRDTRVADSNRFWLSAGTSYNVTPAFTVDGAISHLFMGDASVDTTSTSGVPTTTKGTASNKVSIVSLQGTVRF